MGISINHSLISEIADAAGNVEVIPNYSGRGMFGDRCLAITGTVSELASFVAETVLVWQEAVAEEGIVDEARLEALEALAKEVQDPSMDSLGRESVFYWPRVTVANIIIVGETDEDEDWDEDEEEFQGYVQSGLEYAAQVRDQGVMIR